MSSQKGNASRSRPQKYKNTSKFKNNLHDKSHITKKMNQTVISDCCERCTEIIQWKIDYKKYKLLSQPKKCVICSEKRVTNSYHILCSACGNKDSLCRKCKVKLTIPDDSENIETEETKIDKEQHTNNQKENEKFDNDSDDDDDKEDDLLESDG